MMRALGSLSLFFGLCSWGEDWSAQDLRRLATEETMHPIRPGVPGRTAFWNGHAVQFLWAPAFDFPRVPGAVSYRFFVRTVEGGALSFEAKDPWAPLTPVWAQVPVGSTSLTVEALDRKSQPIGTAGKRQFHRGAVFRGPYGEPVIAYAQSAQMALKGIMAEPFVRSWAVAGRPACNKEVIAGGIVSQTALIGIVCQVVAAARGDRI